MKTLVISTVAFQLNGITSVIMNYFRNINKEDMQIDFLIMDEIYDKYRHELEREGARIYYLPRKANPLQYMLGLHRILKREKYDIVHIHGNSTTTTIELVVAKWNHVPVRIVHSHSTACEHMTVHKLLYPVFKKCYTHAMACGKAAGKWLFRDAEFEILKNGIDLNRFSYNEAVRKTYREKIGVKDEILIGHTANFFEEKNHAFLLDVFAELLNRNEKSKLLLIGDGYLMEEMKEKVNRLGITEQVIFLGKTRDVDRYYQAMDIFVLPSHREGLPVVLVEAQAAGLPCIVSDRVSRESNLSGEVRFVPIDDYKVWADILEAAGRKQSLDRGCVCKAWQRSITEAGYDITSNANHMKELYLKYLEDK